MASGFHLLRCHIRDFVRRRPGRGAGVSAGVGIDVPPGFSVRAFVDRVSYYRDVEWLTFDGRVLFAGAEASLRLRRPGTRPYVTIGAGILNDSGIWTRKTQTGPSQSRVDEKIERTHIMLQPTAALVLRF